MPQPRQRELPAPIDSCTPSHIDKPAHPISLFNRWRFGPPRAEAHGRARPTALCQVRRSSSARAESRELECPSFQL